MEQIGDSFLTETQRPSLPPHSAETCVCACTACMSKGHETAVCLALIASKSPKRAGSNIPHTPFLPPSLSPPSPHTQRQHTHTGSPSPSPQHRCCAAAMVFHPIFLLQVPSTCRHASMPLFISPPSQHASARPCCTWPPSTSYRPPSDNGTATTPPTSRHDSSPWRRPVCSQYGRVWLG